MIQFFKFRLQDYKLMQKYYPDCNLFKKALYCWKKYKYQKRYRFAHMEFFCLHLAEKKKAEVEHFFPRKHQAELYQKVNNQLSWAITKDKFASYIKFKSYYKRSVCAYNPNPSPLVEDLYQCYDWKKEVPSFLDKYNRVIVKPLAEACGRGIQIIKRVESGLQQGIISQLLKEYPKGFVIEELRSCLNFNHKFCYT